MSLSNGWESLWAIVWGLAFLWTGQSVQAMMSGPNLSNSFTPPSAEDCLNLAFAKYAVDIGSGLPIGYEPSGTDWHERLNKLFLVNDEGTLSMIDKDGSNINNWFVGGDLEGLTIADPSSNFVYIGREHQDAILEFNIITGGVTREFDLTPWMMGAINEGLEGLTFVKIDGHPEGGHFWALHQGEGKVYVFELPIVTSSISTMVTPITVHHPIIGRTDASGADYSPVFDIIYMIYDTNNKVALLDTNGNLIQDLNLPQQDQEGIAVNARCDTFITQDTNKKVWFYEGG